MQLRHALGRIEFPTRESNTLNLMPFSNRESDSSLLSYGRFSLEDPVFQEKVHYSECDRSSLFLHAYRSMSHHDE